jgi:hypothetical protein
MQEALVSTQADLAVFDVVAGTLHGEMQTFNPSLMFTRQQQ